MSPENRFNWDNEDLIAVSEQAAIAVYTNPKGDVVIQQAGQYGPSEDASVVVTPENVRALAQAIMREAGVEPVTSPPTNKPMTNAERQRAYRERKRNAAVTPSRNGT